MRSTPRARPARTTLSRAGVISLGWLLVAVVFVVQNVVASTSRAQPVHWMQALWFELEYWFVFLVCSPLFFAMARRFRFEPGDRVRSATAHLLAALAFSSAQPVMADLLNLATASLAGTPQTALTEMATSMRGRYPLFICYAFWKYAVTVGVFYAFDYYRQYRDQQLRAARLEAQLVAAQLRTLKMQLQPHFLFNALHSATMLTVIDPPRAHRLLVEIGEFLRSTLHSVSSLEVPLAEELEFLDRFLRIERVRFPDRLTTRFEIEEGTEDVLIPSWILQPLVENAVHHGMAGHPSARLLVIRTERRDDSLLLEVEDDGVGLPPGWTFERDAGGGLRNVRARIDVVSRLPCPVEFLPGRSGRGTRVRLRLPVSFTAAAAEVA